MDINERLQLALNLAESDNPGKDFKRFAIKKVMNQLLEGGSELSTHIQSGDISMAGVIRAIKNKRCLRAPDLDLGHTYLSQIIGTAIRESIPTKYVNKVRRLFGLSKLPPSELMRTHSTEALAKADQILDNLIKESETTDDPVGAWGSTQQMEPGSEYDSEWTARRKEIKRTRAFQLLENVYDSFGQLRRVFEDNNISYDRLDYLGSGGMGAAFVDPHTNVVVKITSDQSEAYASMSVMRRPVQGVNRVNYVGKLKKPVEVWGKDKQLYIIIQERLDTSLTKTEIKAIDVVDEFLTRLGILQMKNTYEEIGDIEKTAKIHARELSAGNIIIEHIVAELLEAILTLKIERGVTWEDMHPGNVGKDNDGNYVVFDLGVSLVHRKPIPPVIESHVEFEIIE